MADKGSVVVTGASTGIGWGTVKVLTAKGFHVFASVRKQSDADRLRKEFGGSVSPLLMDVTDDAAVSAAAAEVDKRLGGTRLAGLVNNAGMVVSGPLLHLTMDEVRWQFEVNLLGPLRVTQAFAPLLGSDPARAGRPGRVVNISSVGGRLGAPFVGAYVASKHALEGMSETLRRELMLYGIDVIVIGPGAVVTPIWDKAEADDFSRYARTDYGKIIDRFSKYFIAEGRKGIAPEQIGEVVYNALTAARPRVRYAVVPQKLKNWTIPMLLPKRVVDRAIAKQMGMTSLNG